MHTCTNHQNEEGGNIYSGVENNQEDSLDSVSDTVLNQIGIKVQATVTNYI